MIVDKAFMCDLFDQFILGVIILNEWVNKSYNNVIRSGMALNKKKTNSNVMTLGKFKKSDSWINHSESWDLISMLLEKKKKEYEDKKI